MAEFERSLAQVLAYEGGYVNHPKDPGGATNKGVTQAVYDDFRSGMKLPGRSVIDITGTEIETIYRARYWNLIKGDQLPAGVSFVAFDGAVNSGVAQSAKWLQRALGIQADGVIGPATLGAVHAHPDTSKLIDAVIDQRMQFLKRLKTWPTFGKGWSNRLAHVRATGLAWAAGVRPEVAISGPSDSAKARPADLQKPPSKALGDVLAGVGGSSVVISQSIDQAVEKLTPYANIGVVSTILLGLTVAGAAVGICGVLYRTWATIKARQIEAVS